MRFSTFLPLAVSAAVITSASATVTIDWVSVGNAGNAADPSTGYGAVGYNYQIGKYEVTNAQYGVFLNAKASTDNYGLYNTEMAFYGITRSGSSGSFTYSVTEALANRPVVYVSWFDAARFSNWLANGQGSGDRETGSYTFNNSETSGTNFTANPGAQVYIPTENEWYKAAYYRGATYSLYPNGENVDDAFTAADGNISSSASTNVGTYSSDPSFYGTFDQGGNVFEWTDAVSPGGLDRMIRGGSWEYGANLVKSSYRGDFLPTDESFSVGFRVAAIPEPSGLVLTVLIGAGFVCHRRR